MFTSGMPIQRITRGVILSTLMAAPWAGAAAATPSGKLERGNRWQVVVSVGPSVAGASSGSSFEWSMRPPHGLMVHRVVAELVDRAGRPLDATPQWDAVLSGVWSAGALRLLPQSASVRTFELPRPLGLRLDAGDSIAVHGHVIVTDSATLNVRITLDFEPLDGPVSRLAVLPLQVRLPVSAGPADAAGDWQAPVDGRVLVLLGVPSDMVGELVLQDMESGAVLWHEALHQVTGESFGRTADVVRIGAPVQAGRVYRLLLRTGGDTPADSDLLVHALVAPIRAPMSVAVAGR